MSSPLPSDPPPGDITLILQRIEHGDARAAGEILPLVYDELRKLAAARMAGQPANQTLQATALVHEAWLRLGGDPARRWSDRKHFFAAAAEAMRHILIDRARSRQAVRHGGGQQRADFDEARVIAVADDERLLAVNDALTKLATIDAPKAELVKLRYFTGMTLDEAADALGISEPTAKRWWAYARTWLQREIETGR